MSGLSGGVEVTSILSLSPSSSPVQRSVFLPGGTSWAQAFTGAVHEGGRRIVAAAPLDTIPVLVRHGSDPALAEALSPAGYR